MMKFDTPEEVRFAAWVGVIFSVCEVNPEARVEFVDRLRKLKAAIRNAAIDECAQGVENSTTFLSNPHSISNFRLAADIVRSLKASPEPSDEEAQSGDDAFPLNQHQHDTKISGESNGE